MRPFHSPLSLWYSPKQSRSAFLPTMLALTVVISASLLPAGGEAKTLKPVKSPKQAEQAHVSFLDAPPIDVHQTAQSTAQFITPYAQYFPANTILFGEMDARSESMTAMSDKMFKILMPVFTALSAEGPTTGRAEAMTELSTQLMTMSSKLTQIIDHDGAMGLWLTLPEAKDGQPAFHFLATQGLCPGQSIDAIFKALDVPVPQTMPYHSKYSPQGPLTLYFWGAPSGTPLYLFQLGQAVFVASSPDTIQQALKNRREKAPLMAVADVARLLKKLSPERQGTLVLQLPENLRQELKKAMSLKSTPSADSEDAAAPDMDASYERMQAALDEYQKANAGETVEKAAQGEGTDTEKEAPQPTAYTKTLLKLLPLLDIAPLAVGGYTFDLQTLANRDDVATSSFDLFAPVNFAAANSITSSKLSTSSALFGDALTAVVTKPNKTYFADVLPEETSFSFGAYHLGDYYDLTNNYILSDMPEVQEGIAKAAVFCELFGLNYRESVVGLFDDLTAFSATDIRPSKNRYDMALTLNGSPKTKQVIDRALAFSKLDPSLSEIIAEKEINGQKVLKLTLGPSKSAQASPTIKTSETMKLLFGETAPNTLSLSSESLFSKLPGASSNLTASPSVSNLSAARSLSQNADFRAVTTGLPKTVLSYMYMDYHRFMSNLGADMPATMPNELRSVFSIYGPGSVMYAQKTYNPADKEMVIQGRSKLLLHYPVSPTTSSGDDAALPPERSSQSDHDYKKAQD